MKTEYIITREGRIASASPSHPGSHHVLAIRRDGPNLPKKARLYAGSAYHGYDKEHRNLEFPYKKPKNGKLTDEEKEYNRGLSGFRVRVEIGSDEQNASGSPRNGFAIRSERITPRSRSSLDW